MFLLHDCVYNSGNKLCHASCVLSKLSAVNEVVVAVTAISNKTCCVWTTHWCIKSLQNILQTFCITEIVLRMIISSWNFVRMQTIRYFISLSKCIAYIHALRSHLSQRFIFFQVSSITDLQLPHTKYNEQKYLSMKMTTIWFNSLRFCIFCFIVLVPFWFHTTVGTLPAVTAHC